MPVIDQCVLLSGYCTAMFTVIPNWICGLLNSGCLIRMHIYVWDAQDICLQLGVTSYIMCVHHVCSRFHLTGGTTSPCAETSWHCALYRYPNKLNLYQPCHLIRCFTTSHAMPQIHPVTITPHFKLVTRFCWGSIATSAPGFAASSKFGPGVKCI